MIGLKRGSVRILPYDAGWADRGVYYCESLKKALGEYVIAVEHVGSTSVPGLSAKPIIDIAVAVESFRDEIIARIENAGYIHRPDGDNAGQLLFVDGKDEWRMAHIHVVRHMSMEWRNYINFREYLKAFPEQKAAYMALKISLAEQYPNDREQYTSAKADFITFTLRKAMVWSYLGQEIEARVDRPIGYLHTKGNKTLHYPINYGYIPGVLGGDDEELDVYYLGADQPLENFAGRVIAIVHRADDVEDKLVACPVGESYSAQEICKAIYFQEKYYNTTIQTLDGQWMHISEEQMS